MEKVRRRNRPLALAALLTVAGLTSLGGHVPQSPVAFAQEDRNPPLIADNVETENPDLVEVALTVPDGLDVPAETLRLPEGFSISTLAGGIGGPRFMGFDAAGNLLVTSLADGAVYRYPVGEDGAIAPTAELPEPLVDGLEQPSSLAFWTDDAGATWLYVTEPTSVIRYAYDPAGAVGEPEVLISDLPAGGNHFTRTIVFGPDGMMYLGIGSSCNICVEESDLRAAVSRANPDGSDLQVFASGLRNPVGLAFQPETDALWVTVNERDNQGDEIPPDLVTRVEEGANYGWPTCQPPDATPQETGDDCSGVTPPSVGIQAHSAPLGLAFVGGDQLPEDYSGDLIVAQHGSWNRTEPAAPKLLRIDFEDGQAVSASDFATGWQAEDGSRWGRPTGVIQAPDGSLIVSDDDAGLLYRIAYDG